ncbi:hypothetical protein FRB94_007304 [Tulasnella sp. JGI-2019a]|nr:hypothetical protein FRB94_007304 [Tulasnella sp. JGI-2019a]KAG9013292.1 hypothetical protein FRB93_000815 [Tulasnella sp. JGI-2019a]KAG9024217.1 hypothetical protein FRB95_011944 [Tulasnella sp. JGI-2019a]
MMHMSQMSASEAIPSTTDQTLSSRSSREQHTAAGLSCSTAGTNTTLPPTSTAADSTTPTTLPNASSGARIKSVLAALITTTVLALLFAAMRQRAMHSWRAHEASRGRGGSMESD